MLLLLPSRVDNSVSATFFISIMGRSPPRLLRLSRIRPHGLRQRHLPNAQIVKSIVNRGTTKVDYTSDEKSLGGGAMPGNANARNSSRTMNWRRMVFVSGLAVAAYALWNGDYMTALVLVAATVAALLTLRYLYPPPETAEDSDDYIKPVTGIPHGKFEQHADGGFTFSFKQFPELVEEMISVGGKKETGALVAIMMLLMGLVIMVGYAIFGGTKIEGTRDAIIINRKKLRRDAFHGFIVHHTIELRKGTYALLGIQYGRRSFHFGGAWPEGEAREVASALNAYLRAVPMAGDESRVSVEQLREARPANF
jgi:hypothetical protein